MRSKQGKKRPFHTISTNFNTPRTPASQKNKNYTIRKSLTIKCLLN